jgi:hypothetical protein
MQACISHRCRFCSPVCAPLRPRRHHPSVVAPRLHPYPPRISRPRTRSSPVQSAVATPRAEHRFGVWTSIRQRRASIRRCAARFVGAEYRFARPAAPRREAGPHDVLLLPLPCSAAAKQAGSHRPELLPGGQRKGVAAADTSPLDLRRGGRLQLDDLCGFRRPFSCTSLQLAPPPLSRGG